MNCSRCLLEKIKSIWRQNHSGKFEQEVDPKQGMWSTS